MHGAPTIAPLDLIRLGPLMSVSSGRAEVAVAMVDGPVVTAHPDLAGARIRPLTGPVACAWSDSGACAHGTFVAGILAASRGSGAPAICPRCTLLVRPIFREFGDRGSIPAATPEDVATAITECVEAGARVVNLSAATGAPTTRIEDRLTHALDFAVARGALVVAAAGNQATLGSSSITRHAGVIPVVGYDGVGRPMQASNSGGSAGRRGLGAPGEAIVSLEADGGLVSRSGTSFAAAFVTGAIALLWSLFPGARVEQVRRALNPGVRRTSVIPPLLDASAAHAALIAGG
jgi:subtilisin family serine protease